MRFLQLEALLNPAFVSGVQHDLFVAGEGVVGFEDVCGVRIRDLLDSDDDLHECLQCG